MPEKRVLVVDDEIAILDVLKAIIETKGYLVSTAESAEKALEMLSKDVFMVMFLDLKLPGMDGIELCRRIRKDNHIAVIYAFTGYTNIWGLIDCRSAGFDDFFVKPADPKVLLKAVDDAFEKIERWNVEELDVT